MRDLIIIKDYDPRWPQLFERLRSRIAAVLDKVAISIEHVGSTAVPGLAAKPIIDIDVLLRASTDFPIVIRKLANLGYEHRGDLGISGREAFRAKSDDVPHHLYVCPPGSRSHSFMTARKRRAISPVFPAHSSLLTARR